MQLLTLDFETYYDAEYSLKHLPTAQYVHDPRFQIHCLGYKWGENPAQYIEGDGIIHDFLDSVLWDHTDLIGQNLLFDGYILKMKYNYMPRRYIDTKYMAKMALPTLPRHDLEFIARYLGLGRKAKEHLVNVKGKKVLTEDEMAKLGRYCAGDCQLTWGIYDRLKAYVPEQEFELMDLTTRMMTRPQFQLDIPLLKEYKKELEEERDQLVKQAKVSLTTLRSTQKLVDKLEQFNDVQIPMKESPSEAGKMIPTFEKDHPDVAELLGHDNPEVRNIVKARLNVMSSIRINRAKRFIAVAEATGGFFPIPLVYCAAHTGRWGGADKLNAQNIPPGPLREAMKAPRHHTVVVVDLGQIEARITAWLADHFTLLEKFADPNIDPYCDFAAQYYERPIKEIMALGKKSNERFVGKVCVLGLGFGMGWRKLRHQFLTSFSWAGIELSKDEAFRAVELYRSLNLPIKMLWGFLNDTVIPRMAAAAPGTEYGFKCLQYGKDYVRLPSGRCLVYPNLRAVESEWPDGEPKVEWVYDYKDGTAKIYGGKFTENLAQSIARDLIGEQMLKIKKRYPIATMTHDECVLVVHKAEADQALEFVKTIMTTSPQWALDLPLEAEGGYNDRYTK